MAVTASDVFGSSSLDDLITGDSDFKKYKYLPSFRFLLRVDLMFDVPLKSVRPFLKENEYDPIQEGGLNDYVHLKRKPVSKPFTLVVERYVATDIDDPLPNGYGMTVPLLLFIGRNSGHSMIDPTDNGRWYAFTGARVMNKEYGGLDAEKSGLLTETITIGYNSMYCVTIPADTLDSEKPFDFKEDGKAKKNPHANVKKDEAKKSDLEGKANLWQFDTTNKGSKAGQGVASSVKLTSTDASGKTHGEETKADLEKKASKWRFDGKLKSGNGVLHIQNGRYTLDANGNASYNSSTGITYAELTVTQLIARARKWQFAGGSKDGSGILSQQYKNSYDSNGNLVLDPNTLLPIGKSTDETTRDVMAGLATLWKFNNKTKAGTGPRHVQNAQFGKDADGNPVYNENTGLGISEDSREDLAALAREWKFTTRDSIGGNNVNSAVTHRKSADAKTGEAGTGVEEKGKKDFADKAKLWTLSGTKKEGGGTASRAKAAKVESSLAEMISKSNLWEMLSAKSKSGTGKASRAKGDVPEQTKDQMIALALEKPITPKTSEKPTPRLWPDVKSAQKNPNPATEETKPRLWPPEQSARKIPEGGEQPVARLWPEVSSANKISEAGLEPEARLWPDKKSAQTNQEKGSAPKARLWPQKKSAQTIPGPGKPPERRKWPEVRSAQTITDFLMK